jgi:hypothetical protein
MLLIDGMTYKKNFKKYRNRKCLYFGKVNGLFPLDYSNEFLKSHHLPGYSKQWKAAIISGRTGCRRVYFILAISAHISIFDREVAEVEINFLCVKTELCAKHLTDVLIKEITI